MDVARIVLGLEEHAVAEEVMHFLDRSGRARVVATASDERQLAEAVRQLEPDAVVASTALVPAPVGERPLFAVETDESVKSLRAALRVGAAGYFLWPRERDALASAAARASRTTETIATASVVAVLGARGGVGATFVALQLAASMARRSVDCALVDLDVPFAGLSGPLGAPDDGVPTAADLVRFGGEPDPSQVRELLWHHPEGFGVLLAPGRGNAVPELGAVALGRAVAALAGSVGVVVLHVPREVGSITRMALATADPVLLVLQLSVATLRDTGRLAEVTALDGRGRLVVNRARRSSVTPRDLEHALGAPCVAIVPEDRAVGAAMDGGGIVPRRSRAGRAIDRLARDLMAEGL